MSQWVTLQCYQLVEAVSLLVFTSLPVSFMCASHPRSTYVGVEAVY